MKLPLECARLSPNVGATLTTNLNVCEVWQLANGSEKTNRLEGTRLAKVKFCAEKYTHTQVLVVLFPSRFSLWPQSAVASKTEPMCNTNENCPSETLTNHWPTANPNIVRRFGSHRFGNFLPRNTHASWSHIVFARFVFATPNDATFSWRLGNINSVKDCSRSNVLHFRFDLSDRHFEQTSQLTPVYLFWCILNRLALPVIQKVPLEPARVVANK